MPVRILITEGTWADCKEAVHLIEGISAETLLADRGYDTNDILSYAVSAGMEPVIPPKKNRKEQRGYDKYLYQLRHLVENAFCLWNAGEVLPPAMPRPRALLSPQYMFVVSIFGLLYALNTCRHYLVYMCVLFLEIPCYSRYNYGAERLCRQVGTPALTQLPASPWNVFPRMLLMEILWAKHLLYI